MNAHLKSPRTPDHPIDAQFLGRWSSRAFDAAPLTAAELMPLLEAARWAPSANNFQPWRFAYGLRGDAAFGKIAEALVPFNRAWAEKSAALVVIASRSTVASETGEQPNAWAGFDTGAAWGYFALQAHLSGLVAHAMAGFDAAVLAKNLALPDGYVLHAVVAVGHPGDKASLPEMLQSREVPNDRVPLTATVGHGGFV